MHKLNFLLDKVFYLDFVKKMGLNHLEPTYIEILEVLQKDISVRERFFEIAKMELEHMQIIPYATKERPVNFIDCDLLLYIAHVTKWGEFNDLLQTRLNSIEYQNRSQLSDDFADDLIDALSDNWEDKIYYPILSHSKTPTP